MPMNHPISKTNQTIRVLEVKGGKATEVGGKEEAKADPEVEVEVEAIREVEVEVERVRRRKIEETRIRTNMMVVNTDKRNIVRVNIAKLVNTTNLWIQT
ncbi:MAG: hypothetical protein EZS28_041366, partial [Streblomastix strix]